MLTAYSTVLLRIGASLRVAAAEGRENVLGRVHDYFIA